MISVDLMSLWAFVYSVHLCSLWEKEQLRDSLGRFFSHRTHRFNRTFPPTFRPHRRPPAYRVHRALLLKVAVRFCEIGWLNVSVGLCVFCSSVFSVRKNMSFSLCHYVILSKKPHLSRPVPLLFCLQNYPVSLCHYVILSKKPHLSRAVPLLFCLQNYPVSLCHYVILSKKMHLSPPVPLLFCLQDHPFCYSCPPVTLSSKLPYLPLSLCHSV